MNTRSALHTCTIAAAGLVFAVIAQGQISSDGALPASRPATASAPAAVETTSQSAPAEVDLGQYKEMPEVCRLSADQVHRLKVAIAQGDQAIEKFRKESRDEINRLNQAQSKAMQDRDLEKVKSIQDQLDDIQYHRYARLRAQRDQAAMDVLTPEQRMAWEKSQLKDILSEHYWKVDFTKEQAAQAEKLYDECAAKAAAVKITGDEKEHKARQELVLELAEKIDTGVLKVKPASQPSSQAS